MLIFQCTLYLPSGPAPPPENRGGGTCQLLRKVHALIDVETSRHQTSGVIREQAQRRENPCG